MTEEINNNTTDGLENANAPEAETAPESEEVSSNAEEITPAQSQTEETASQEDFDYSDFEVEESAE